MNSVALQRAIQSEAHAILRSIHIHLAEFEALRTYAAVPRWTGRAAQLTNALKAAEVQLSSESERLLQEAELLRAARMKRFFLVRLFLSRRPELAKRTEAERAMHMLHNLQTSRAKLLECIDYTPNDDRERRTLLKELKLERKELRLQKRDVNASKREIHRRAKEASAHAGKAHSLFAEYYDPSLAAEERREIRRDRYSDLSPFEDQSRNIEWQLREVERRLLLVERFGNDTDD